MAFEDWDAFAAGPLRIPIRGKTYVIPEMSGPAVLALARGAKDGEIKERYDSEADALESWRALLTDEIFDQMIADGVPAEAIQRAGMAVRLDNLYDREVAEEFWKLGKIPERLAALAAAAGNGTPTQSPTHTGEATTTRRPAPGSGTSTRRNTRTSKTAATASRGRASSRSGR